MADSSEIAQVLSFLAAAYPRFEVKADTVRAYCAMLADVPIDDLRRAAVWCIANSQWFPAVSELRAAIAETAEDRAPDADEAWNQVLREIRRVGSWGNPEFSHSAITMAVEGVGWKDICMSDKIGVERAHFLKAYETTTARHRQERISLPLLQNLVGQLAAQKRLS